MRIDAHPRAVHAAKRAAERIVRQGKKHSEEGSHADADVCFERVKFIRKAIETWHALWTLTRSAGAAEGGRKLFGVRLYDILSDEDQTAYTNAVQKIDACMIVRIDPRVPETVPIGPRSGPEKISPSTVAAGSAPNGITSISAMDWAGMPDRRKKLVTTLATSAWGPRPRFAAVKKKCALLLAQREKVTEANRAQYDRVVEEELKLHNLHGAIFDDMVLAFAVSSGPELKQRVCSAMSAVGMVPTDLFNNTAFEDLNMPRIVACYATRMQLFGIDHQSDRLDEEASKLVIRPEGHRGGNSSVYALSTAAKTLHERRYFKYAPRGVLS